MGIKTPGASDENMVARIRKRTRDNPAWQLMQVGVEKAGPDWAFLRMKYREALLQILGTVHGGFLAMVADSAAAAALWTTLSEEETAMTLDLSCHYVRPVVQADVVALAQVKYRGRTTAVVDCTLYADPGSKEAAFTTATFLIRPRARSGDTGD